MSQILIAHNACVNMQSCSDMRLLKKNLKYPKPSYNRKVLFDLIFFFRCSIRDTEAVKFAFL